MDIIFNISQHYPFREEEAFIAPFKNAAVMPWVKPSRFGPDIRVSSKFIS
jgi:hypothetical protein